MSSESASDGAVGDDNSSRSITSRMALPLSTLPVTPFAVAVMGEGEGVAGMRSLAVTRLAGPRRWSLQASATVAPASSADGAVGLSIPLD